MTFPLHIGKVMKRKPKCFVHFFYEKDINGYRLIVLESIQDYNGIGMVDVIKAFSENGFSVRNIRLTNEINTICIFSLQIL